MLENSEVLHSQILAAKHEKENLSKLLPLSFLPQSTSAFLKHFLAPWEVQSHCYVKLTKSVQIRENYVCKEEAFVVG